MEWLPFTQVTVERSYCHAAPDRSDTSFLVKETIDFCEANNPYFLARSVGQGSGSRSLEGCSWVLQSFRGGCWHVVHGSLVYFFM